MWWGRRERERAGRGDIIVSGSFLSSPSLVATPGKMADTVASPEFPTPLRAGRRTVYVSGIYHSSMGVRGAGPSCVWGIRTASVHTPAPPCWVPC